MKKKYQYITLAIITILVYTISFLIKTEPRWYVFIIVYVVSMIIGKFFYVLREGVNLPKVQFVDSDSNHQLFYGELQLGFSKVIQIEGLFDNSIGLSESDITQLIYDNTTRKMVLPLYENGEQITLSYNMNETIIEVTIR